MALVANTRTIDSSAFSRARVLVVGDVMLDRYWSGEVERISPEAPVPVLAVNSKENRAGGAANVANNIASLGAACVLLSVVGKDEAGQCLSEIMDSSGVDCRLHRDDRTATTIKLRVVSRNQQLLRMDLESPPSHEVLSQCLDDFRSTVAQMDVVVMSDYGKGGLTHISEMIQLARDAGVPVSVDPKGRDFSRYRGASLITPNRKEFEDVVGECADDKFVREKAYELIKDLSIDSLLLTRSERGMILFKSDGSVIQAPAKAREVFDVTGAGDTVISVISTSLAAGMDDHRALELANAAAGLVVGRLGTATVTLDELQRALSEK